MSEFGNIDMLQLTDSALEPVDLHPQSDCEFYKGHIYGRMHFVKRLKPSKAADPIRREALRKEFLVGYKLDHPSIAKYLFYKEGTIYQEYIDGVTIAQLLASDRHALTSHASIAAFVRQLLNAVSYLHSQEILHLDIKPDNIMLTRVGHNVKLLDLGCCLTAVHDSTPGFTPGYQAPEQVRGCDCSEATDIYQVGVVVKQIIDRANNKRLSRRWSQFIAQATAAEPSGRFASASECVKELPRTNSIAGKYVASTVGMLVVGAIALWLWPKPMNTPTEPERAIATESAPPPDTLAPVATSAPPSPLPAEVKKSATPTDGDAGDADAKLKSAIMADYEANVYHFFSGPEFNDEAFFAAVNAVRNRATAMTDSLAKAHPDRESTLRTTATQTIALCQNHCGALRIQMVNDTVSSSR